MTSNRAPYTCAEYFLLVSEGEETLSQAESSLFTLVSPIFCYYFFDPLIRLLLLPNFEKQLFFVVIHNKTITAIVT